MALWCWQQWCKVCGGTVDSNDVGRVVALWCWLQGVWWHCVGSSASGFMVALFYGQQLCRVCGDTVVLAAVMQGLWWHCIVGSSGAGVVVALCLRWWFMVGCGGVGVEWGVYGGGGCSG